MSDASELGRTARAFLEGLAGRARAHFNDLPMRLQKSTWMVNTSATSAQTQQSSRQSVDRHALSIFAQRYAGADVPESIALKKSLVGFGVSEDFTHFGYVVPLTTRWVGCRDPFHPMDEEIASALDELISAVADAKTTFGSVDITDIMFRDYEKLRLDDEVVLRRLTAEELWELGESDVRFSPYRWQDLFGMLRSDTMCIDISAIRQGEVFQHPDILKGMVIAALRLASEGVFRLMPLGQSANYGAGAFGRSFPGETQPTYHGLTSGQYAFTEQVAERLRETWGRFRDIFSAKRHFLRLPAQRLVDGGLRRRPDDAIVDYAIGLEALLLSGARDELAYRFSLRGAYVMSWGGGDIKGSFDQLKLLYRTRSKIVHGDSLEAAQLTEARTIGDLALRQVWWWFFANSGSAVDVGTALIDDRILK